MSARTLAGMTWVYGSYIASRLMVLVVTAILARLLDPSDFGLVALALTFMVFLDVIRGLGPTEWIVVVDETEVNDWAETVWSINVIVGLALAVITAALGPVAAKWFDEPGLVQIMPVLGANWFIAGLSNVHDALAQKRMNFRARTVAELTEVVARGSVGITLAFAGAGVWALVLGYVAGSITKTVALWIVVPWRPHVKLYREHLPRLWRFGGALSGVGLMAAMLGQFDNIVVGRVLGTSALGFYVLATRLPELLIINLSIVAGQVLFPAFATYKEADMGRPFLTALHYSLVIALPMTAFLAILAEPLILIAFGDKWGPAVGAMQVLALWAMFSPLSQVCGVAYKAMGRADILLKIALLQVVLWAPTVLLVASKGIVWVAGVQAVVSGFIAILSLTIQGRRLRVRGREVFDVLWPPLVAAGALALTLFGITRVVSQTEARVACGAAAGAVVYIGLLWVLSRPTIARIVDAVRPRRAAASQP